MGGKKQSRKKTEKKKPQTKPETQNAQTKKETEVTQHEGASDVLEKKTAESHRQGEKQETQESQTKETEVAFDVDINVAEKKTAELNSAGGKQETQESQTKETKVTQQEAAFNAVNDKVEKKTAELDGPSEKQEIQESQSKQIEVTQHEVAFKGVKDEAKKKTAELDGPGDEQETQESQTKETEIPQHEVAYDDVNAKAKKKTAELDGTGDKQETQESQTKGTEIPHHEGAFDAVNEEAEKKTAELDGQVEKQLEHTIIEISKETQTELLKILSEIKSVLFHFLETQTFIAFEKDSENSNFEKVQRTMAMPNTLCLEKQAVLVSIPGDLKTEKNSKDKEIKKEPVNLEKINTNSTQSDNIACGNLKIEPAKKTNDCPGNQNVKEENLTNISVPTQKIQDSFEHAGSSEEKNCAENHESLKHEHDFTKSCLKPVLKNIQTQPLGEFNDKEDEHSEQTEVNQNLHAEFLQLFAQITVSFWNNFLQNKYHEEKYNESNAQTPTASRKDVNKLKMLLETSLKIYTLSEQNKVQADQPEPSEREKPGENDNTSQQNNKDKHKFRTSSDNKNDRPSNELNDHEDALKDQQDKSTITEQIKGQADQPEPSETENQAENDNSSQQNNKGKLDNGTSSEKKSDPPSNGLNDQEDTHKEHQEKPKLTDQNKDLADQPEPTETENPTENDNTSKQNNKDKLKNGTSSEKKSDPLSSGLNDQEDAHKGQQEKPTLTEQNKGLADQPEPTETEKPAVNDNNSQQNNKDKYEKGTSSEKNSDPPSNGLNDQEDTPKEEQEKSNLTEQNKSLADKPEPTETENPGENDNTSKQNNKDKLDNGTSSDKESDPLSNGLNNQEDAYKEKQENPNITEQNKGPADQPEQTETENPAENDNTSNQNNKDQLDNGTSYEKETDPLSNGLNDQEDAHKEQHEKPTLTEQNKGLADQPEPTETEKPAVNDNTSQQNNKNKVDKGSSSEKKSDPPSNCLNNQEDTPKEEQEKPNITEQNKGLANQPEQTETENPAENDNTSKQNYKDKLENDTSSEKESDPLSNDQEDAHKEQQEKPLPTQEIQDSFEQTVSCEGKNCAKTQVSSKHEPDDVTIPENIRTQTVEEFNDKEVKHPPTQATQDSLHQTGSSESKNCSESKISSRHEHDEVKNIQIQPVEELDDKEIKQISLQKQEVSIDKSGHSKIENISKDEELKKVPMELTKISTKETQTDNSIRDNLNIESAGKSNDYPDIQNVMEESSTSIYPPTQATQDSLDQTGSSESKNCAESKVSSEHEHEEVPFQNNIQIQPGEEFNDKEVKHISLQKQEVSIDKSGHSKMENISKDEELKKEPIELTKISAKETQTDNSIRENLNMESAGKSNNYPDIQNVMEESSTSIYPPTQTTQDSLDQSGSFESKNCAESKVSSKREHEEVPFPNNIQIQPVEKFYNKEVKHVPTQEVPDSLDQNKFSEAKNCAESHASPKNGQYFVTTSETIQIQPVEKFNTKEVKQSEQTEISQDLHADVLKLFSHITVSFFNSFLQNKYHQEKCSESNAQTLKPSKGGINKSRMILETPPELDTPGLENGDLDNRMAQKELQTTDQVMILNEPMTTNSLNNSALDVGADSVSTTSIMNENIPDDPLQFHAVHGDNIKISKAGFRAQRLKSSNFFNKGIAFSSRPIRVNEQVSLRLRKLSSYFHGLIAFGFTNKNPSSLAGNLPSNILSDHIEDGYWAVHLDKKYCEENNRLHYFLNSSGNLCFGVNGKDQGELYWALDTTKPIWALIDITGYFTAVEFYSPKALCYRGTGESNSLTEKTEISDSQDQLIEKSRITAKLLPLSYQSQFVPLDLNTRVKGFRVQYMKEAGLFKTSDTKGGRIFLKEPLFPGQTIILQNLSEKLNQLFCIGVKYSAPTTNVTTVELTDQRDPVAKSVTVQYTDELAITFSKYGEIRVTKNSDVPNTILLVNPTQQLWPYIIMYKKNLLVRMWSNNIPNLNVAMS